MRAAQDDLPAQLRRVVDYRKSGLSLNHVVGCPLDCAYCVRHMFNGYDLKRPHLVLSDEEAVTQLVEHWAFRPNITPIQIFNRATDPFLPGVKDHLFAAIEALDRLRLTNHLLIITRWKVEEGDVARLDELRHLKVTVLVTWSGITDERIEPVDSTIAETSLKVLAAFAARTRKILYWRPLIGGVNDTEAHFEKVRALAQYADAIAFTGIFLRDEMREHFKTLGAADPYHASARRKIMPEALEQRIIAAMRGLPLFRKTSCAIAFAHAVADYNGHFGIRELCDICPSSQRERCAAAHLRPRYDIVHELASFAGLDTSTISIDDRRIEVSGSTEQQRYFLQHVLNYQVHDSAQPHHYNRHGRAEIGWT
jgi:DNA repair photolyase